MGIFGQCNGQSSKVPHCVDTKNAFVIRSSETGYRCADFIRLIMSMDMHKKSTAALMHSDNITHKWSFCVQATVRKVHIHRLNTLHTVSIKYWQLFYNYDSWCDTWVPAHLKEEWNWKKASRSPPTRMEFKKKLTRSSFSLDFRSSFFYQSTFEFRDIQLRVFPFCNVNNAGMCGSCIRYVNSKLVSAL